MVFLRAVLEGGSESGCCRCRSQSARQRARNETAFSARTRAAAAGAHGTAATRHVIWSTEPEPVWVIVVTGHILDALRWSIAWWRETVATTTIAARAARKGAGALARRRYSASDVWWGLGRTAHESGRNLSFVTNWLSSAGTVVSKRYVEFGTRVEVGARHAAAQRSLARAIALTDRQQPFLSSNLHVPHQDGPLQASTGNGRGCKGYVTLFTLIKISRYG